MAQGTESPILIDVWTVDPSRRDELIDRLTEDLRTVAAQQRGFESSEIFQSIDGGVVVVIVRMGTAHERQQLMDREEARGAFRAARAIAHTHANVYSLVEVFAAGAD